jgi:hypothetical protein
MKPVAQFKTLPVKVRVDKLFDDTFSIHKVLKNAEFPWQKLKQTTWIQQRCRDISVGI